MNTKKILAMVIALAMIVAIVPTFGLVASAAEGEPDFSRTEEFKSWGSNNPGAKIVLPEMKGVLNIEFDLVYLAEPDNDTFIGFGNQKAKSQPDFGNSAIGLQGLSEANDPESGKVARFRNGGDNIGKFNVTVGETYHIALTTDTVAHTYGGTVTGAGNAEPVVFENAAYRATGYDTIDAFVCEENGNQNSAVDRAVVSNLKIYWVSGFATQTVVTKVDTATVDTVTSKILPNNEVIVAADATYVDEDEVTYYLDTEKSTLKGSVEAGEEVTLEKVYGSVESVAAPEGTVATRVGVQPALPKTVKATLTTGGTADVAVEWDEADVSKAGTGLKVSGKAAGKDVEAAYEVKAAADFLAENLVAQYEFEEETFEVGATVADSSDKKNDATVSGATVGSKTAAALESVAGVNGKAVSTAKGGIELPAAVVEAMKAGSFTIATYIKKNDTNNQSFFTLAPAFGTAQGNALSIYDSNTIHPEFWGQYGNNIARGTADADFVHFALAYDANNGIVKYYYNGVQTSEDIKVGDKSAQLATATVAGIGISAWPDQFYNGAVDDFRIYTAALTVDEIAAIVGLVDYEVALTADGKNVGSYKTTVIKTAKTITVPAGVYGQYYLDAAATVDAAEGASVEVKPLTMFTWNNDAHAAVVVEGTYNVANVVTYTPSRTGYAYIDASKLEEGKNVIVTLTGTFNNGIQGAPSDVEVYAVKGLADVDLSAGEEAQKAIAENSELLTNIAFTEESGNVALPEDAPEDRGKRVDATITLNIGSVPAGVDALAFKAVAGGIFVIKGIEIEATDVPTDLAAPTLGWDEENKAFTIDFAYASEKTAGPAIRVFGLVEEKIVEVADADLDGAVGAAFVVGDTNAQYAAAGLNGEAVGKRTAATSVYKLVMEAVASANIDGEINADQLAAVNKILAAGGIFVKEDGKLTAEASKVLTIDGTTVKIIDTIAAKGLAFTTTTIEAGGKYKTATINSDGTVTLSDPVEAGTEEVVVYLEDVEFVLEAVESAADEAVSGELDFIEEV